MNIKDMHFQMGNIVKLVFLCGHSPIRLMDSLSLMYTANGKRQIQVENFSKYE